MGFFKKVFRGIKKAKIGRFIGRNVRSAVRDTAPIISKVAPLLGPKGLLLSKGLSALNGAVSRRRSSSSFSTPSYRPTSSSSSRYSSPSRRSGGIRGLLRRRNASIISRIGLTSYPSRTTVPLRSSSFTASPSSTSTRGTTSVVTQSNMSLKELLMKYWYVFAGALSLVFVVLFNRKGKRKSFF